MSDDLIQFTAIQDFWSDETKSQYCEGLGYRVTADLVDLIASWEKEGKIRYGAAAAQVSGEGA